MTVDEINSFFLVALNYALRQRESDGQLPATAVIQSATGTCTGCTLHFSDAKSKAEAIARFVSELKTIRPPCAVVVVPIPLGTGKRGKRKNSLCVAFQSLQNKFVSVVNYETTKKGEFVFESPHFCDDTEIILSGHEYFGDAFDLNREAAVP